MTGVHVALALEFVGPRGHWTKYLFPVQDNDEDEERLWRDLIMERVTKSADACLTALNIMTSTRMPKAVYIEDVIERVLQYTKFHLQNTLYPQYDPVYRVDPHGSKSNTPAHHHSNLMFYEL